MAKDKIDPFISYYQRELAYLRKSTADFALQYPKIARRLDLGQGDTADPHVESLIETFSYLTARLQREIDDQYPLISNALLDILYPHLTTIIPPMTVAQLWDKAISGKSSEGVFIAKGSAFRAKADQGAYVEFNGCYDTHVWPVSMKVAEITTTDLLEPRLPGAKCDRVLRLRLVKTDFELQELNFNSLRFYIDGDRATQNLIYQMLFTEDAAVWLQPNATCQYPDPPIKMGQISPVGFSAQQLLLSYNELSHPAYVLMSEFLHFPQKFMFFDVDAISSLNAKDSLDILIAIPDRVNIKSSMLDVNNFKLGCVPIINLFKKTSEPFGMNMQQVEYQLVPDYRQNESMEVHSIEKVYTQSPGSSEPEVVIPYFGFDHKADLDPKQSFWFARKKPSKLKAGGMDSYISFVDLSLKPSDEHGRVVYADIYCTNRSLACEMPQNCVLIPPLGCEVHAVALNKPTHAVHPKIDGETQWKLISHLSINYFSLSGDEDRTVLLKEMLNLYSSLVNDLSFPEIHAITQVKTRQITRRGHKDIWRGFLRGTEIELTMKEMAVDSNAGLLLAFVLNEFFALNCHTNTFIELVLKIDGRDGIWKRWNTHSGAQFLL